MDDTSQNELLAPDQARDENWRHTREAYENNPRLLLRNTLQAFDGSIKTFYDKALKYVPLKANILEIGSGDGCGADYLEALGYTVLRTDPIRNFVRFQKSRGKKTHQFDVLTQVLAQRFDLVLAPAVFHHFDDEDFEDAAKHVFDMLPSYGIFSLCGYSGVGARFKRYGNKQRYFCYRTPEMLSDSLKRSGFIVEETYLLDGTWANCIASKP